MARRYGASPLHLLGHIALFALAAWAIGHVLDFRGALGWVLWFLGAAILHDIAFLPAYTVLDRLAGGRRPARWINFLRVPAVVSGTLLLVWFPLMLQRSEGAFEYVSGDDVGTERLRDWLLVTAVLFGGSLLAYVIRSRRSPGEHLHGAVAHEGDAARGGVGRD